MYGLYQEGKVAESVKLQGLVSHAEKACKAGIAATKYGAAHFAGPVVGISDKLAFLPRKPYASANETMQAWVVKTMEHLEKVEKELPDRHCPGSSV